VGQELPALAPGTIGEFVGAVEAFALGGRLHSAVPGALLGGGVSSSGLGAKPLRGLLHLGFDTGEIDPAQRDEHLMAVQGGFQGVG
jgi:hypothetical protein